MDQPEHVEAYRRMRILLQRAGLTLTGLQSQLARAGFSYSYDSITSWGRANRGFPRNPQLLATIVRILITHLPTSPQTTREIAAFLRTAGYPADQLHSFADILNYEAIQTAFSTAPDLFLPQAVSEPGALPDGSRGPPFAAFHGFRGRDALLTEIATHLSAGAIVLLSGIGGIGKTMLAAEFAYRYGRFFAGGLFWLNADTPQAFWQDVLACGGAEAMAIQPGYERISADQQRSLVLARWAEPTPRLIVLDNLDDIALLQHLQAAGSGCRLLITSQQHSIDPALRIQLIEVPPLQRSDSMALLRTQLAGFSLSDPDLDAIAAAAGDVPLALHLAGQLLLREGLATPEQIAAALTSPSPENQPLALTPSTHTPSINDTIQRSIARLVADEPSDVLARLLLVCAAHCAPGTPLESDLLLAMAGPMPATDDIGADELRPLPEAPPRARRALQRLIDLGLLERALGVGLRLHRLVAGVARMLPEAADARSRAEICLLLAGRRRRENVNLLRLLLPHQEHLVQQAGERADRLALLLRMDLGWNLLLLHSHDAAWKHLRVVMAILSARLDNDHPDLVEARIRLGLCYQFAGEMRMALPIWQEILASIRRRGPDDVDTYAREIVNAGMYFTFYGDYQRAESLLREALALRRRELPLLNEGIGRNLRNLALLHFYDGRLRRARRYAQLAIAIFEQIGQSRSLMNMYACWLLGEIYIELGEWQAAGTYVQYAIDGYVDILAPPGTRPSEVFFDAMSTCLRLLAQIEIERGQRGSARRHLESALHIARMTVGEQGFPTAQIQRELARLDLAEGHYLVALDRCTKALTAFQNRGADDHVETARTLHLRGRIEAARGRVETAQQSLESALAMLHRLSLRPHPQAGYVLQSRAELALQTSDRHQARQFLQAALQEFRASIPRHPATEACAQQLGDLL
jgi:tetratricopeptide (TPR) repeat protein